jgi:microcin C transport system substrate-binding protein
MGLRFAASLAGLLLMPAALAPIAGAEDLPGVALTEIEATEAAEVGAGQPAPKVHKSHAIAMHGEPKYGPDFTHFDYVNPDASTASTASSPRARPAAARPSNP